MQSFSRLILLSALVVILPLGFALAKADADIDNEYADIKAVCLKTFTAEQIAKDPNAPCYEQIRGQIDEKLAEGRYYDANLVQHHGDECDGCHVKTSNEIAVNAPQTKPFWESAVPAFGGSAEEAPGGGPQGGTD